jgi:predicted enzyme related to lactoylglutathione lyase
MPSPLLKTIDCLQVAVPDLEAALTFYCVRLGHTLAWRAEESAGLRLPGSDAELVLQTERPGMEVDFQVDSADAAARDFAAAGGRVLVEPFDIRIGRCVVVEDPWGNRLVLLDMSKGRLVTDAQGRITGNEPAGGTDAETGV